MVLRDKSLKKKKKTAGKRVSTRRLAHVRGGQHTTEEEWGYERPNKGRGFEEFVMALESLNNVVARQGEHDKREILRLMNVLRDDVEKKRVNLKNIPVWFCSEIHNLAKKVLVNMEDYPEYDKYANFITAINRAAIFCSSE